MKHLKPFNESDVINSTDDITITDYQDVFEILQSVIFDDFDMYQTIYFADIDYSDPPTWFINDRPLIGVIMPLSYAFKEVMETLLHRYKPIIKEQLGVGYLVDTSSYKRLKISLYRD